MLSSIPSEPPTLPSLPSSLPPPPRWRDTLIPEHTSYGDFSKFASEALDDDES